MPLHIGNWEGFNHAMDYIPSSVWFFGKTFFLIFIIMWFRWTFPRLRIDQLLNLEWKYLLPISMFNLLLVTVMVILGATSGPSLHPMHYWFVAAAFFAFHLLLAYLVDHISVHLAFAVSAAVSLALVVSDLRLVTGMRHALLRAGAAQAVFLVLFSYAFFFEGFTGLAITIGAVVTLFVLMQITARVSWDDVFAGDASPVRRPTEVPDASR